MWSEFIEFFGSGDPNMFDTDDEFQDEPLQQMPKEEEDI